MDGKWQEAMEAMPLPAAIFSDAGQPLSASSHFLSTLGETEESFQEHGRQLYRAFHAQQHNGPLSLLRPDGSQIWLQFWQSRREGQEIVQVEDVTKREREKEHLQLFSRYDGLTGLPNREEFVQRAETMLHNLHRNLRNAALAIVDIDHLKLVEEDGPGEAGGRKLQEFASTLRSSFRTSDLLARLGSDEFVILMPETDKEGAEAHLHDIAASFVIGEEFLSLSAGISILEHGSEKTLPQLLEEADRALLHAKAEGGNRVEVYGEEEIADWPYRLHVALQQGKMLLQGERTQGPLGHTEISALIEEGGEVLSSHRFLPSVSGLDIVREFDTWLLHRALDLAQEREELIAITISSQASLADFTSLHGLLILLEEEACLADMHAARSLQLSATRKGAKVGVRDFGRQGGPFYYLRYLPQGVLKIQQGVLSGLLGDDDDRIVAEATLDIAERRSEAVVAFGLDREKEKQLAISRGYGAQGPLLSPAEEIAGQY